MNELPEKLEKESNAMSNYSMRKAINQIIDYLNNHRLTEEKDGYCSHPMFHKGTCMTCGKFFKDEYDKSEKPKKPGEWCCHTKPGSIFSWNRDCPMPSDWKFCPLCGTPRPVEKPLRERLAEKLKDGIGLYAFSSLELADCAIAFLQEEKEEK